MMMPEYTSTGFLEAAKSFDPKALDVDLTGKSFLITGSNTGIGKTITTAIATRGGTVHMMCQFPDEETRQEIVDLSGNKNIFTHVLDLSLARNVYKFAKDFADSHESLDVLVNNAGVIENLGQTTEEGLKLIFAVNTLAPYILTTTLLPLLQRTPGSRVVNMCSAGMLHYDKLDLFGLPKGTMEPFNPIVYYGQTKRWLAVMTEMFARTYATVQFSAMHPGVSVTNLMKATMPDLFAVAERLHFRSPEEGGDTAVWLSVSDAANSNANGQFYFDRKVAPYYLPDRPHTIYTEEEKHQVMDTLKELTAVIKKM